MLSNNDEGQNRFKLKKYRGILMGQLLDIMNMHDSQQGKHHVGSQADTCDLCSQFNEMHQELDQVNKLLSAYKRPVLVADDPDASQRHFYYICSDAIGNMYVVRARNKDEASNLLHATQADCGREHVKHISRREAFQTIENFEGARAQQTIHYLQHDDYYLGVVSQLNSSEVG